MQPAHAVAGGYQPLAGGPGAAGEERGQLKGGVPFIFGRGGEELQVLAESGIAFEVVPGITAVSGAACYAGIPLTHRDYAQSCVLTTGHLKDDSHNLDWPMLARLRQTVVVYMGLAALPTICRALVAHGQRADMPVAVIERGTLPQQRVVTGTLTTIAALVSAAALQSPSLTIIGDVVNLHPSLRWFAGTLVDELETA